MIEKNEHSLLPMAMAMTVCVTVLLNGCTTTPTAKQAPQPAVMTARYTGKPVKIDGILDDEAWTTARTYALSLGRDRVAEGKELAEPGEVRLAWDDTYFYVAITFHDSDIVAEGKEDQLHHYQMGDLVELFLKPEGYTWYWELYATPTDRKTSFWFPGRGRLGLESGFQYECGLQVAAQNSGTLNEWSDKDSQWTAEMAMPIKDLTAHGESFGPGSDWRVLVARYNYSRYLSRKELSMVPQMPRTDYHVYEDYGALKLVK